MDQPNCASCYQNIAKLLTQLHIMQDLLILYTVIILLFTNYIWSTPFIKNSYFLVLIFLINVMQV